MPQLVRTSFRDLEAIARTLDATGGAARVLGKPVGTLLEGLASVDLPLLVVIEVLRVRWPRLTIEKLIRSPEVHEYLAETVEASRVMRLVERVAQVVVPRVETTKRPAPEGVARAAHAASRRGAGAGGAATAQPGDARRSGVRRAAAASRVRERPADGLVRRHPARAPGRRGR